MHIQYFFNQKFYLNEIYSTNILIIFTEQSHLNLKGILKANILTDVENSDINLLQKAVKVNKFEQKRRTNEI